MLPPPRRVRSTAEHRAVARRGKRYRSGPVTLSLLMTQPSGAAARAAVVAPRAVGNAVTRHRLQRQARHLLAQHLDELPRGSASVMRLSAGAADLSPQTLRSHMQRVLLAGRDAAGPRAASTP